jgi:hypothetical protein
MSNQFINTLQSLTYTRMSHPHEARPSSEWHEQKACFETYFPEGQIVRVALDDLPEDIVNQLEGRKKEARAVWDRLEQQGHARQVYEGGDLRWVYQ